MEDKPEVTSLKSEVYNFDNTLDVQFWLLLWILLSGEYLCIKC